MGGEAYGAFTAYSSPNSLGAPWIYNYMLENGTATINTNVTNDPQQAWYAEIDIENSDGLPFAPTLLVFGLDPT